MNCTSWNTQGEATTPAWVGSRRDCEALPSSLFACLSIGAEVLQRLLLPPQILHFPLAGHRSILIPFHNIQTAKLRRVCGIYGMSRMAQVFTCFSTPLAPAAHYCESSSQGEHAFDPGDIVTRGSQDRHHMVR